MLSIFYSSVSISPQPNCNYRLPIKFYELIPFLWGLLVIVKVPFACLCRADCNWKPLWNAKLLSARPWIQREETCKVVQYKTARLELKITPINPAQNGLQWGNEYSSALRKPSNGAVIVRRVFHLCMFCISKLVVEKLHADIFSFHSRCRVTKHYYILV